MRQLFDMATDNKGENTCQFGSLWDKYLECNMFLSLPTLDEEENGEFFSLCLMKRLVGTLA